MSTSADTTRVRTAGAASTWWTTFTASVPTTGRARPVIPVSYVDCVYVHGLRRPSPLPTPTLLTHLCVLDRKNDPFSSMLWTVVHRWCVTSVFLCDPGQAKVSVTQPLAVTEAPATTAATLSAVPAHPVGEEMRATRVRILTALERHIYGHNYNQDYLWSRLRSRLLFSWFLLKTLMYCQSMPSKIFFVFKICDLWLILALFPQPGTAHVPPVLVPTVGPVWEEETRSPASAKRAGKARPVAKVSLSLKLCS